MTFQLGIDQYALDGSFVEGGVTFAWFNPLQELALNVDINSDVFQFWCRECGSSATSELANIDTLIQLPAPLFLCFDAINVAGGGDLLCALFRGWMYSSFWARWSGGTENTCSTPGGGG